MFSSQADLKRPYAAYLPTPDEVAAVFKKPRTLSTTTPLLQLPLANCLPADAVPIVAPPFETTNFFVDVKKHSSQKQSDQMNKVLHKFPPPLAPPTNPQLPYGGVGVMVPFVFPPVPVLRPDKVLADPVLVKKRGRKSASQLIAIANAKLLTRIGVDDADVYPVIAPLPFPLPNYMPYPLISDNATLTPDEVFAGWLMALEHLPRTDMVVASAAGSIFDFRAEVKAAGLTIDKLDRLAQIAHHESDPEANDASDSDALLLESVYDEYIEYAQQVDTSSTYDPLAVDRRADTVVVDLTDKAEFTHVAPLTSSRGRTLDHHLHATFEYSDRDVEKCKEVEIPEAIVTSTRDIVNAVGAQKERRRLELSESYHDIETYANSHRNEVYTSRKLALLARLRALQQSRIFFDDNLTELDDPELAYHVSQLQALRDIELLRLKFYHSYEKLKAARTFYQTSNRAYKNMNTQLINRLQKLKNFFEYQKSVIRAGNDPDSDLVNVRSKESAKLYNGFSESDYLSSIKDVFREAVRNEDLGMPLDMHPDFDADIFRRVYTDRKHQALVHDLMPLVTEEEFKLIVGDAPQKTGPVKDVNGKPKSVRHPIFQSPLYDPVTSGSDTNGSDGGAPTFKRRPGRRAAPKPALGDPATMQNSEAALLAKIMKQFVGPAQASADELTGDLDAIGIETRWPVK